MEITPVNPATAVHPLDAAVTAITTHAGRLTADQVSRLRAVLPPGNDETLPIWDGSFDLKAEVTDQIRAVKALRRMVFHRDGQVRSETTTREAKEVISASTTLLTLLMKCNDEIDRSDRLLRIERAVIATLEQEPEDVQRRFFSELELALS